jgi:hypothetical protein
VTYSLWATEGPEGQPLYALDRGDQRVSESHDPEPVIRQLMWQISGDTVELADGYLLVHAGAVVTPRGDGVVILGEAGSGKSTVVAALVQEGFGYLSDEAAAIELDTGLLHPWPRPLGFKHGSRSMARFAGLFEDESQDPASETHVPVDRIRSGAVAGPSPVGYVIDHRYEPGARLRIEPLSRATAVVRMGSAAPRLRREGDRGLAVLAGLMQAASAYSLVSGELGDSVRAIRQHVMS